MSNKDQLDTRFLAVFQEFLHGLRQDSKDSFDFLIDFKADSKVDQVSSLHVKLAAHQLSRTLEVAVNSLLAVMFQQRLVQDYSREVQTRSVHQNTIEKSEPRAKFYLGIAYELRQVSLADSWITPVLNRMRHNIRCRTGELAIRVNSCNVGLFHPAK